MRNPMLQVAKAEVMQVPIENSCQKVISVVEYYYEDDYGTSILIDEKDLSKYSKDKEIFQSNIYEEINCSYEDVEVTHIGAIAETNLLRIDELLQENQILKNELCQRDATYSWCGGISPK